MNFYSPTTRERLDQVLASAQPHLIPIFQAVRNHRCGMMFVPQGQETFRIPREWKQPAIAIIGDDYDQAHGPDGFHLPSLRRLIRNVTDFAVISSAPEVAPYATMSMLAAVTRENVMIVETRPEREIEWVSLIQKLAPRRFIWLNTVEGAKN